MGRKLKVGDKVKLSAHGLKANGGELGIAYELKQAQKRGNRKSTYEVIGIDLPFVKLGNRTGFHLTTGPLASYWLRRDWVKRAD